MTDLLPHLPTRIALSLPAADMAVLSWQAERRGVPLAERQREKGAA